MLWFFRKYQKFFLIIFSIMIVVSFSFFGTYSAMNRTEKPQDRIWGKAIDGQKIYEKELRNIAQFLETDAMDGISFEDRTLANYCNEGVLVKDILETGIARMLFAQFFAELVPDGEQKLEYHSKFSLYEHIDSQSLPLTSTMRVWQQHAPRLQFAYHAYKAAAKNGYNLDLIDAQIALFLKQKDFAPNLLRQFLVMGERQNSHVLPHDPYLERGNLALFHAKTASDWFGKSFLSLVAQYIHNSARLAEQRGHRVSLEEARRGLLDAITRQVQRERSTEGVDAQEIKTLFFRQAHKLDMDEYELTQVWQKVLLFRKLFNEVSHCVVLDNLMYNDFSEFAAQIREVELVELPHALKFGRPNDMLKWALYMQAIHKEDSLDLLNKDYKTTEEVLESQPLLVQKPVVLHLAQTTKQESAKSIGLKELKDWQLSNEGWQFICTNFAWMTESTATQDQRFKLLNDLSRERIREVDIACRAQMVEMNAKFIERALLRKEVEMKSVTISYASNREFLPGCKEGRQLLEALSAAAKAQEDDDGDRTLPLLSCYTEDGVTFSRIVDYDDSAAWSILTLQEAKKEGVLDILLTQAWQKHGFTFAQNEDLNPHMDAICEALHIARVGVSPVALLQYVEAKKVAYEQGDDIFAAGLPVELTRDETAYLSKQWQMNRRNVKIKQVKPDPPFTKAVFTEPIEGVSFVDGARLAFYRVIHQSLDASVPATLREKGTELLQQEMYMRFAKDLLGRYVNAQAIRAPVQCENE